MIKDSEKVAVIELYGAAKFDQVFIERRRKNEQTAIQNVQNNIALDAFKELKSKEVL